MVLKMSVTKLYSDLTLSNADYDPIPFGKRIPSLELNTLIRICKQKVRDDIVTLPDITEYYTPLRVNLVIEI